MSIQNARSNTSGRLPTAIPADGQLFIQQADDILFTRKPDGTFRQFLLPKRVGVVDTSYTVNRWDTYIGISTLTAPHTIALPAAGAYPAGHPLTIVDESGACAIGTQITITPNGTDTINGAVSLPQTSANFGVLLFSDGVSKWTAAQFSGSAGLTAAVAAAQAAQTAAQNAQTAAQGAVASLGQCRLDYVSTTQINLNRRNGRLIFINGTAQQIPASGVALANTGLTQATLYYVYAYMSTSGGNTVMALEASTTTYATDATYGTVIKSGDPTRTLVGMVYMDTGAPGLFADTPARRYVASFHNRRPRQVSSGSQSGSTSSSAIVEFTNFRIGYLTWTDNSIVEMWSGTIAPTVAGSQTSSFQLWIDGVAAVGTTIGFPGNISGNPSMAFMRSLAEGYHTASAAGNTNSGGTVSFSGYLDVQVQI